MADMIKEDQVLHIKLDDIFVDHNWNSRSLANVQAESSETGDKEGTGIVGLTKDLFMDGQDDPVVIRETKTTASKSTKPYMLVTGFRRYEAVRRLNTDKELSKQLFTEHPERAGKTLLPNSADGTIRAFCRTLPEKEARALNVRENTLRDDLTPPDLMRGIAELAHEHKMTQVEIGERIGKAQGYVGKLLAISTLDKSILEHWRGGGEFRGIKVNKRVTTDDMRDISKLDKDRQIDEYLRIISKKAEAGAAPDKNQWVDALKKKAEQVGWQIGLLQRQGFLKLTGKMTWIDVLEYYIKLGKGKELKAKQEKAVAKAAEDAFNKALTAEEEVEEEEEEGDD